MAIRGDPDMKEYDNLKGGDGLFTVPKTLFKNLIPAKNDLVFDMKAVSSEMVNFIEEYFDA